MAKAFTMTQEQDKVLSWLTDEESKLIYRGLCQYHALHDAAALSMLEFNIYQEKSGLDLLGLLRATQEIVLFGAGSYGWGVYNAFSALKLPVVCFGDNSVAKQEKLFCHLSVLSAQMIHMRYPSAIVVIAVTSQKIAHDIQAQLSVLGFEKAQLVLLADGFGTQYYDCDALRFDQNDVMVDAGCFDGTDILNFVKKCGGACKRVLAFEPNSTNRCACQTALQQLPNCKVLPYGLWDCRETLQFLENGASSCVCSGGTQAVEVVALDEILPDGDTVTFLKMDIEGAELRALQGAARVITQNRPKLAICIYHKVEDLTVIPLYLKQLVPDYRFAIRHYGFGALETVLYAY